MAIWIHALSWALIYSLGQGFLVFGALWTLLKIMHEVSSRIRYYLSLLAISVLLVCFVGTWWQQFNNLTFIHKQVSLFPGTLILEQLRLHSLHQNGFSFASIFSFFKNLLPWLSVFYIIGLSFMLIRLSSGMMQLFALKQDGTLLPDKALQELLRSWKSKLHLNQEVKLLVSVKARVPMVIGFFKPIILLPASSLTQLSTEQLETILLHELAHIKRHDYLINMLQTIAEAILFFNPFVWLISALIRREREHCCDDLVLVHTNEPLYYATALAALAAYPGNASGLLVAATGKSHHLFHRIKRILEMEKNPFSYSRMVAAILIITAICGSVAWLTPSFANSKKTKTIVPPAAAKANKENNEEEMKLVRLLSNDHLIDETKGFTLERKGDNLYIDYRLLEPEVSAKYLPEIEKKQIRVEVYPIKERIKQHPGASLLQLSAPVILSSPCVDYKPKKKEGC